MNIESRLTKLERSLNTAGGCWSCGARGDSEGTADYSGWTADMARVRLAVDDHIRAHGEPCPACGRPMVPEDDAELGRLWAGFERMAVSPKSPFGRFNRALGLKAGNFDARPDPPLDLS